ncbi:MAG TPA: hypothetical protein VFM09_09730 [Marmoricola sp.]|nr:hypothetical protein [Marmoricola sp.]
MAAVVPFAAPVTGDAELFLDARGGDRVLRVRWHREEEVVVLSMWRGGQCTATFRLAVDEVPTLVAALRAGLDRAYEDTRR